MSMNKRFALLCAFGLLLLSNGAIAQLAASGGIMDTVLQRYSQAASQWTDPIMKAATFLFVTLGTISLVWTAANMALKGGGIQDFFGEMVKFLMFFGFFLMLLRWGPFMANAIVQSMIQLGSTASGSPVVSPSALVDVGFNLLKQYSNSRLSIEDVIPIFFLTIGIIFIFAIISINLLLVYITSWILAYAGILFLGFGGSRWTSDMAIGYYKSVFATGVQLLAMILIIGVGVGIVNEAITKSNTGLLNISELVVIFVTALTLLFLVDKIPAALAGIISGGGTAGMQGIGSYGAAAGMAAAGAAAGAAASTAKAGVGNLIGGSSALKAAFNQSQSGSDASGAMAKGVDSAGDNGGTNGSKSPPGTASETPFAKAAGLDTGAGAGAASGTGTTTSGNSASSGEAGQSASASPADGGEGVQGGGSGDDGGAAKAAPPDALSATGTPSDEKASASGPLSSDSAGASDAAPRSSLGRAADAIAGTASVLGKNAVAAAKQSFTDLGANSAMGKLAKRIDGAEPKKEEPKFEGDSISKASKGSQGNSQTPAKAVSAVNAALPAEVRAFMEKK